jgi:V8-like Glu-specific endopeptidase
VRRALSAAWRWLTSRTAAWIIAGVAILVALAAIIVPKVTAADAPDAASFNGLPQAGALFDGAWASSPHFCSGAVVDSPSGDVIVTAAHCVSGSGKDLEFVPMYHDGQAPYGAWDVTGAYVSQRWMNGQDPQADFAFLTVAPQQHAGTQRTVQSVVGGDRLVTQLAPPQWTVVVGYPAGTGGPIICLNRTAALRGYAAFKCAGFVGGTSGGPWLADYDSKTAQGDVYGVTGGRHQGGCLNWESYTSTFDAGTMAVYQRAAAAAAPDMVPVAGSSSC